jgi:penicillin-binding protein 2
VGIAVRYIPEERQPDATLTRPLIRDDMKFAAVKIAGFQWVIVAVFVFLLSGFWDLQIRNEEVYNEKAQANQIKSLPIPAPRGKILDRDGRVIVDNHDSFRLILSRDTLREEHLAPIAQGLNLDPAELAAKVNRFKNRPTYFTISLKEELTPAELTFVEAHRGQDAFPEMELIKSQYRVYPGGGLAGHLLGYVGEINDAELNSAEWAAYNPGDVIGKTGLERFYNERLKGVDGQRRVRVDKFMNTREVLGTKEAIPGQDLRLTIDLDLQVVAELAMEGRRGAVVALNPQSGEVLALVSTPSYDPNHFVGRIDSREWSSLQNDENRPLFNRALQAQLAPGSTFKPIMLLAALEEGIVDDSFTVTCGGGASFYGHFHRCHKRGGHGRVNLTTAMAQSCDVFFYTIGNRLGIDRIAKYSEMAGLGQKTGIDLPQEKEGLVPSTTWKIRRLREKWYAGETISVSIGQGALTVTPLQLAHAIGGIATGGVWMKPHLVKTDTPAPARKADLNIENVNRVLYSMYAVVNEGGTGGSARVPGLDISGKTGTSQRASDALVRSGKLGAGYQDDAWFVGFAPRHAPEIVVAALFENGEHGNLAGPIVRDVIKAWFDKKSRAGRDAPNLARRTSPAEPQP